MARIIGLLVLLLAALTLGGCAGLPYGALGALGALDGGAYGGYGGAYPQGYPSAAAMPVPVPVDPGYAAAPSGIYVPSPEPYYAPAPEPYYGTGPNYAPGAPPDVAGAPYAYEGRHHPGGPWVDRRERDQAFRIRQGLRDGSLTPQEARRLWAEQRHIRGAEGRMRADGDLNPAERGRLNAMQNRANRDIYRARHNGMVQPGVAGPYSGGGAAGPMHPMVRGGGPGPQAFNGPAGVMAPRQFNGGPRPGAVQPQARRPQAGGAPRGSIVPIPSH